MSDFPEDVMKRARETAEAFTWSSTIEEEAVAIARAIMQDRSARQAEGREDNYQERVAAAHHALFHDDPTDVAERVARFFEEAIETCQAFGLDFADAHKLVNYTYDRPVGEPAKEIGAAMLTLASLCVVAGYDLMTCAEADLDKLQRPETIARIRAKRSTRHGRGPLPGFDASGALDHPEGSANNSGSNGETLEKSCRNDAKCDPENENIGLLDKAEAGEATPPQSNLVGDADVQAAINLGAAVLTRIEDPAAREIAIRNALTMASQAPSPNTRSDLYDADVFMADGGDTPMTAAENLLAWLLVEKIGVPDDVGYSPNQAQEVIVRRLDLAHELEQIDGMLAEGQGDDEGHPIMPEFTKGMTTYAKVEACLHLLERRRDALHPSPQSRITPADTDAAQSEAEAFDTIVAARKAYVDAVAAYNARLEFVRAERERGNWLNVDPEYASMSEAQSAFYRTVQELADGAIRQRAEEKP